MAITKTTYNVFRAENRENGREDWVGTVEAEDADAALVQAQSQFECPMMCSLYVVEASDE